MNYEKVLKKISLFIIIVLKIKLIIVSGRKCTRYPLNTQSAKSPVDDNFIITISGNPHTYILGQVYNITLHALNGHRFINAKLALENDHGDYNPNSNLGRFQVLDPVATHYSPNCVNVIETTNTNPKHRLDVQWIAPSEPGSGCILIRATVVQHRDIWFMDDGGLTKRVCEEVVDDVESQKKSEEESICCACDEARYEITFESLWSRNLHPKDFPSRTWMTRFSYIMGTSHASDYRFWDIGELASTAMQEFAEHGSTQGLEDEFNDGFKEGKIRTIVKARGPGFPKLNGYSLASIRVDPSHHQLSLAAKLEPSPDWFVGVAGLELCLTNCTWLPEKNINLYPWDVGTDAGFTYTSHDQPQIPPDVIRRTRVDDPRSPFYDESGVPMKPLAVVKLRRQRLYERKCLDEDSNHGDGIPRECFTHPWSPWSNCSSECGEGTQYRHRVYKQPEIAKVYNCDALFTMKQERACQGENCGPSLEEEVDTYHMRKSIYSKEKQGNTLPVSQDNKWRKRNCQLGAWSPWSICNSTCGEGKKLRTREYLDPFAEEECQNKRFLKLHEFKKCFGHDCLGDVYHQRNPTNTFHKQIERNDDEEEFEDTENNSRESFWIPDDASANDEFDYAINPAKFESANLQYVASREAEQSNSNFKHFEEHKVLHSKAKHSNDQINEFCYKPLQLVNCADSRVIGNYWFYNICSDECILYAADICDRNLNRFMSLEKCEEICQLPLQRLGKRYLKQQQQNAQCFKRVFMDHL